MMVTGDSFGFMWLDRGQSEWILWYQNQYIKCTVWTNCWWNIIDQVKSLAQKLWVVSAVFLSLLDGCGGLVVVPVMDFGGAARRNSYLNFPAIFSRLLPLAWLACMMYPVVKQRRDRSHSVSIAAIAKGETAFILSIAAIAALPIWCYLLVLSICYKNQKKEAWNRYHLSSIVIQSQGFNGRTSINCTIQDEPCRQIIFRLLD